MEPARVFRIGHCVFKVSNADEAVKWFRDTLGMLVTDRIHVPDNAGVTLGTFLRCNKGKNPAITIRSSACNRRRMTSRSITLPMKCRTRMPFISAITI